MQERTTPRAKQAAELALKRAQDECLAAQIDPDLHEEMLTKFVIEEVGLAMAEMAHDKAHGGPTAAFTLTQPFYQNIYFADAGRRAAHAFLNKVAAEGHK